jgi:HSP20 family protein
MSFFPTNFISASDPSSFHPLFRFLDDFDSYNQGSITNNHTRRPGGSIIKSFTPKFDVKEVKDGYQLHGELPGVDQKDIEIEFTDSQTVVIRGRTERTFTSGTPPAGFVEGTKTAGAISDKAQSDHHATVEDEQDAANTTTPAGNTQVAKTEAKSAEPQEKYWVSERSVGEFSRSFTFPVRVDSDNVQASMKNGILSILVPKAKKDAARKITIN